MTSEARDVTPKKNPHRIHVLLFILTLITTTFAGALQRGINPLEHPFGLLKGLPFSLTIMTILLVHEMGHYITSRFHRVPATLPYFIPAPSFIGTFGAVIRLKGAIWDRRALLDIGVSGPLAGFIISVPALAIGFAMSEMVPVQSDTLGIGLGDSLLVMMIGKLVVGTIPEGMDVILHPVGFAGWLGLFVTSLNLIPVGQLDGGHISKALFPIHSDIIARVVHFILIFAGIVFWEGWLIWALLLVFIGIKHPPVMLPHIQLDEKRRRLGYTALAVFIVTFVPTPFVVM